MQGGIQYRRKLLLISLVVLFTLIVLSPCLKNGFITWDDDLHVSSNAHIQGLSLENIILVQNKITIEP